MRGTEREVAAGLRTIVVDHAVEARDLVAGGLAAMQRCAPVAVATDLEVRAAIDNKARLRLHDGIAFLHFDRVVRGAAACAARLAVERGFIAFARVPRVIDLLIGLPAARDAAL